MADPEFSREEVQGTIFHGAPQQSVAMPVEQKATAAIPVPPPLTIKSVEKSKPVANKINASALVETVGSANKQLQESIPKPEAPSAIHGLVEEISNNWKPLAIGGAAAYGASRLLGGKKPVEAVTAPATRVEPTFATPEETATFKPIEQPTGPTKLAAESQAKFGVPLADVENHFGVKVTNIKDAEILSNNYKNSLSGAVGNAPAGVPGVNPMDQLTKQPPAPQLMQPKPPAGATPPAPVNVASLTPPPPAPVQTSNVGETVATGGNVDQVIKQSVANQLDQADHVHAGPVAPTLTKQEQGMMNHLLGTYGGKDNPFAIDAYNKVKEILGYTPAYPPGKGGGLAKEETGKILGYRKENIPGPKVNLTHEMKSVLRKGGPALAAMIATTEFANAKTAEDRANAGINLLGAILPPGMDINAAGAPGVNQSQISNAALLGSPYAQTEWAKAQRLRERAGAGRGIAPPSAYQR